MMRAARFGPIPVTSRRRPGSCWITSNTVSPKARGHASEGSGMGYGEYEITDILGPAIEKTRSPFDVQPA
jgi:hypothetical protein